jgi:hypothetical protein
VAIAFVELESGTYRETMKLESAYAFKSDLVLVQ